MSGRSARGRGGVLALVALAAMLLTACTPPAEDVRDLGRAWQVVDCARSLQPRLDRLVTDLPGVAGELGRFVVAVEQLQDFRAALEEVFGQDWRVLTADRRATVLLIASGIRSCEGVSDIPDVIREIFAIDLFRGITLTTDLRGRLCTVPGSPSPFRGDGSPRPVEELRLEPCGAGSDLTDALLDGTYSLARTTTECINLPEGCGTVDIPVRIGECAPTRCVIARTDGVWRSAHELTPTDGAWSGTFDDVAIACRGVRHIATITIVLIPSAAEVTSGTWQVRTLRGTYSLEAATNPGCDGDVRASYDVVGTRG